MLARHPLRNRYLVNIRREGPKLCSVGVNRKFAETGNCKRDGKSVPTIMLLLYLVTGGEMLPKFHMYFVTSHEST